MQVGRPGYRYHLLRGALERFSRNLARLDPDQLAEARRQADQTYSLEALVLAGPEAAETIVAPQQLDAAFAEVATRYADQVAFETDLAANGLDAEQLRQALHRELVFNNVMQRVAARRLKVSQLDARLYYELNQNRFVAPEQRKARQILITVNDDYAENTREIAGQRIRALAARLQQRPNRFAEEAHKHSECPSALEGGRLGSVSRGQLFPELDAVLFAMREGEVSEPIETGIGFHILRCDGITRGRRIPFSAAEPRIREFLDRRAARNCQKAYLKTLREARSRSENA
jgi:peptidyl-prolyl cis-trans isomerase C